MSDIGSDEESLVGGDDEPQQTGDDPNSPSNEKDEVAEDDDEDVVNEAAQAEEKKQQEEAAKKAEADKAKAKAAKQKVVTKTLAELGDATNFTRYNRQSWVVPTTALARDYRRAFVCSDAGKMAAMSKNYKNWPPIFNGVGKSPKDHIGPAQIVVVQSCREPGADPVYVWYVRLEVEGKGTEHGYKDAYILTFVPQPLYKKMVKTWSLAETMRNSGLLKNFQSQHENDRPFDPKTNDWVKIAGDGPRSCLDEEKKDNGSSNATAPASAPAVDKGAAVSVAMNEVIEDKKKKGGAKNQSSLSDFQKKPDVPKSVEEDVVEDEAPSQVKMANGNAASSSATTSKGVKRRRDSTNETWEFLFTEKKPTFENTFNIPDGAKSASLTVTYKYD